MIKNSRQVMDYIKDPNNFAKPAQVGVDLTLKGVARIFSGAKIPRVGKTEQARYMPMNSMSGGFILERDKAYAVTFDQGLKKLPDFLTAFIVQRSSLNRNGCRVVGSVFDPGYGCENLGATIYPTEDIFIEEHARIAQILLHENHPVDDLYVGQYSKE